MEPSLRQSDDGAGPKPAEQRKTYGGPAHGRRARTRGAAQQFGGIHLRRDKRFPFAGRQSLVPDAIAPSSVGPSDMPPAETGELKPWKEAVMLWLSWNSTYEKLTARMCKPGQDQSKIEGLLDEMDQLRRRAIELSEQLFA